MARPLPRPSPEPDERLEGLALSLLERARGKPAARPAPPASFSAAKVLQPLLKGGGLTLGDLRRSWSDIVGEQLARVCSPEKLTGQAGARTLTITAHAAAAPLLQHQSALILERLRLAGADAAKLSIKHGAPARREPPSVAPLSRPLSALEEQAIEAALAPVQDSKLRAALHRLGRAVAARR